MCILLWSKYYLFARINKLRLCTGGELFDRIIEKGHFSENEARTTFS